MQREGKPGPRSVRPPGREESDKSLYGAGAAKALLDSERAAASGRSSSTAIRLVGVALFLQQHDREIVGHVANGSADAPVHRSWRLDSVEGFWDYGCYSGGYIHFGINSMVPGDFFAKQNRSQRFLLHLNSSNEMH